MNIPIYRAKKIDSEYVEGFLIDKDKILEYCPSPTGMGTIQCVENRHYFKIDTTTLSIHFPNMTDSQGNKIFASLQEDGKGGDIFISKSYPFYGDAPEITDSSGKCEELNYKGLLFFTSTGCYMDYIKVSDRVRGCAIGCAIEDFNEFKSIGIQE